MFPLIVLGLASAAYSATITVTVAEDQKLAYSPNNFKAARGDIISFQFLGGAHTVSQSGGVDRPCVQLEAGFDSGLTISANGTQVWEIVIEDDTKPIWFYCKQALHCQVGMAGVINAVDDSHLDAYIANAKLLTDVQQTPQVSLKGIGASAAQVPVPANDDKGAPPPAPSRSSLPGDRTPSPTPTQATPSSSPSTSLPAPSIPRPSASAVSKSGASTKLIVAIVVPAVSSILALGSLFILLRRRRRRRYRVQQPQHEGIIPYSVHTSTEEAAPQMSKLELVLGPEKSEPGPSALSELRELHSAMRRAGLSVQTLLSSLRAPRDALSEGSPPQYEA